MSAGTIVDLGGMEQAGESRELQRLLDAAEARLLHTRRTFTEEEALHSVWEAGYEVSPQTDPRFVLAREAEGKHPRHWRLAVHRLANDRLLSMLADSAWDGRDLDAELARISAEDNLHYIFCPLDQRFTTCANGVLERADREETIELPEAVKTELEAFSSALLDQWSAEGWVPWSTRQVTEALGRLGWSLGERREGWLLVRAWLCAWPEVARSGQDSWIPIEQLPPTPQQARLRVMPLTPRRDLNEQHLKPTRESGGSKEVQTSGQDRGLAPGQMLFGGQESTNRTAWVVPLRTAHLVGGFVPAPSSARAAYPARALGEGTVTVLRALWFESGERLWIWLDREQDRLYGPQLADHLGWRQAGDLLRVEWAPDVIVLRIAGHDAEVQAEETRLVDLDALAALRGGLGESYRASLQAILEAAPAGLTFAELVAAIRERQSHVVHRGSIRAVLHAGGFVQREGRWFAAPEAAAGARMFRAAIVTALLPGESAPQGKSDRKHLRARAQAIRGRLAELVDQLSQIQD